MSTPADHYVAIFRNESPETIREAIDAVLSVDPADVEHADKLLAIVAGLKQLLPTEPQGSLF